MRFPEARIRLFVAILFVAFVSAAFPEAAAGTVFINEIMSSNASVLADEDGDYPDWIELYNSGDQTVSLDGYTITDDPVVPEKWTFPAVEMAPEDYMIVYASDKDLAFAPSRWDAVVSLGHLSRYHVGSAPPSDWNSTSFDDSAWPEGPTGIGSDYSTTESGTELDQRYITLYVRTSFTIDNVGAVIQGMLHMDFEDGFVAYLNGQEIARLNMGESGSQVSHDQFSDSGTIASLFRSAKPAEFPLESVAELLLPGENILAVEVHTARENAHVLAIPLLSLEVEGVTPGYTEPLALLELTTEERNLHTNFKLSAAGETLVLSTPEGAVADSISTGTLDQDVSLGRSPDGGPDWMLFDTPTPFAENGEGYLGYSEANITASLPGGFYSGAQELTLSADVPGAAIMYTLDGSLPEVGIAELYDGPIAIDTTTVVRASSYEVGYLPGPVATQTYVIDEPSTIPVVSLTFNPPDLWDDDTGFYVEGNSDALGGYPDAPVTPPANWNEDWEKQVHVEFFEPDGTLGFATDAGAKIHGKQNRRLPQKSFSIHFRDDYGLDELDYPLFPGKDLTEFKSFILRNAGHDWESAMCRDVYLQDLMKPLDMEWQDTRTTHVYINGVYWGILHLREKLNEDYLASHKSADPDAVDILDDYHARFLDSGVYQAHPYTTDADTWTCYVSEGTADHYNALLKYMVEHDETDPEVYAYLKTQIDIENFVDYMVSRVFVCDPDGPGHNTKLWRPRTEDGRWRWLMYDLDFGAGLSYNPFGVPGPPHMADMQGYYLRKEQSSRSPDANFLLYSLIENEEFRAYYANRYADLLNTIYSQEVIMARLAEIKALLEPEINRHIQRWKDEDSFLGNGPLTSKPQWLENMAVIEEFAGLRTHYARINLNDNLGLGSEAALTVNNGQTGGGIVRLNTLDITDAQFSGIYFTGVPVQLTAIPRPGWRFAGWSGAATETDASVSLSLTGDATITANFVEDATAVNTVMFNEISYNASDNRDSGDWVELYSAYTTPVDLGNWVFRDSNDTHEFTIPAGTMIEPGQYLVLCRDMEAFSTVFPQVSNVVGSFGFGLSSDGELIRLYDSTGALVDSLTFGIDTPWPSEPNGNGPTLELKSTSLDNALAESWEKSDEYGTPGISNDLVLAVEEKDSSLPAVYQLGQNYPNPFNPVTTIPFDLPIDGMVRLEIYNALGQRIAVPVDRRMPAGHQAVVFDAADLPSGFLFYRLKSGSFTSQGKMLLLK